MTRIIVIVAIVLAAGWAIAVRSADQSCVAGFIPDEYSHRVPELTTQLEIARLKYASPKHAMLEQAQDAEHLEDLDLLAHLAFKYCW
ncbi:hypothetical protein [Ruegeria atlantica]|uniref:Uncharacterized protein n=1 Tax=Ruegeria atlantica TaxID=81569 RepID=A0A0P1E132_9RHOB|nr:hypothetical protein [Ruegeria atlantica]CUH41569.1 hypothetical protein RUM4293_00443 [Ruegeria atlantica]